MAEETPPNLIITLLQEIRSRLDRIEARLDGIDGRIDGLEGRMDRLEREMRTGFAEAAAERADLAARISRLDADATKGFMLIQKQLDGHRAFSVPTLSNHEARIAKLEAHFPPA